MKRAERLPWPVNESGEPEKAEFLCNIMPLDMKDEITMELSDMLSFLLFGDNCDAAAAARKCDIIEETAVGE